MESNRDKRKQRLEEIRKEKQRKESLKKEQFFRKRKLGKILSKNVNDRTDEECSFVEENKRFVSLVECRLRKQQLLKSRAEEIEDELSVLEKKIDRLVDLIRESDHIVVYTGAGISTSSNIPDYRGPKGVWTQLHKNGTLLKTQDLALAVPTYTHMALSQLAKKNIIKHIVSQNCDGLHLRSGLQVDLLSEIHGNMYVEVCRNCQKVYYRDFDVTERTALHHHQTGRRCVDCAERNELIDTIVHFGEKGNLEYPLNWKSAIEAANQAELIICLGSSLRVLKNYLCLWPKRSRKMKKLHIVIVNLMWTPKDSQSSLKINAKCDLVMEKLMEKLNIKVKGYDKELDQLKKLHIPLQEHESASCRRYRLFASDSKPSKSDSDQELTNIAVGWFGKGVMMKKVK